jgi:nucleoporin NDC1
MTESSGYELNLVEALSADKIQIVQQLAALDLYYLSDSKNGQRRQQFYQLSVPGGHPYNWKHLSDQCLRLMKNYTNALATAIETEKDFGMLGRPVTTPSYYNTTLLGRPMTPATEMAEKILNRQFNELSGIRNLMQHQENQSTYETVDSAQQNAVFLTIQKRIDSCRQSLLNAPGFYYLFNESKNSKISFILSQSPTIISITKGLTAIVTHSITEDRYGVVQNDLAPIIKTLLQTKVVLEKIGSNNVDVKKVDRNYIALKNATRRSIYRIATVFADYINDLALDTNDLKILQNFIYYKEL